MNDKDYEMIGESIWDTYRRMASLLAETEEEEITKQRPPTREELRAAGPGTKGTAYGHKRVPTAKGGESNPKGRASKLAKGK